MLSSPHLTLDPELHQLAVRRSQSHRCHLRLLGTQLAGERFKVMFIEAEVLKYSISLVESSTGKEEEVEEWIRFGRIRSPVPPAVLGDTSGFSSTRSHPF